MTKTYGRVMAALDGKHMDDVARKALRIAADNGASLCLAHAVDSLGREAAATDLKALAASVKTRLEDDLADVLAEARANPSIPAVDVVVEAGPVAETLISSIVPHVEPDLVVCGKRGLSNVKYLIVGSVSTQLIRQLRCDVLVVRP